MVTAFFLRFLYLMVVSIYIYIYIYSTLIQQSVVQVKELRHKQQMKRQAEYGQKLVSEKQLIKNWRGDHMKEEIGDEVWIPYGVSHNCNTTNILPHI
jgi:hypothetical protein